MSTKQEVVMAALERQAGMDQEASEALRVANEAHGAWYGTCPGCGTKRHGSLVRLQVPCQVCAERETG